MNCETVYEVDELTTNKYTATITDENGAAVPAANIQALTLTLYDYRTNQIINSRDGQNVLNTNGVTIHETSGLVTWTMEPADNPIITPGSGPERHKALFVCTYDTVKKCVHEVNIDVRDVPRLEA